MHALQTPAPTLLERRWNEISTFFDDMRGPDGAVWLGQRHFDLYDLMQHAMSTTFIERVRQCRHAIDEASRDLHPDRGSRVLQGAWLPFAYVADVVASTINAVVRTLLFFAKQPPQLQRPPLQRMLTNLFGSDDAVRYQRRRQAIAECSDAIAGLLGCAQR